MALVLGTNCGFVTVAPVDDPEVSGTTIDNYAYAFKVVAPSGAIKVTEIGWYSDSISEEANFEVGIYSHNAGTDFPDELIGVSRTNAKGTTKDWKKVTGLNIEITEGTTYWIAVQLDDTATTTSISYVYGTSERNSRESSSTELASPWVSTTTRGSLYSIYAVYEAAPTGTNMKINIADAWKDVDSMKINIADAWKDVAEVKQNIGDAWKVVF